MPVETIDYDAPDLAARIERLSHQQIDQLPFGVILLDCEGIVQLYSATETRQSGYPGAPLGLNFFKVSPCFGKFDFSGRIARALETPPIDLELALPGDYGDPKREVRVRVQSASQGGVWLFMQRD
jgi:photoactive yellow protein